jgi:glycosyltransferase involved in cell wall biosynthesis
LRNLPKSIDIHYDEDMNIGLLLPSLLMADRFADRIFAPKDLFLALADGLVKNGHNVFVYSTSNTKTRAQLVSGPHIFEQKNLSSIRVRSEQEDYTLFKLNYAEYEMDLTTHAYQHAKEHNVAIMHSYHDTVAHYVSPLSSIPTVYTLHDPSFAAGSLEGWRFDRFNHDTYVAISKRQADIFAPRVHVASVVYHGIDNKKWEYESKAGDYLAFGGRFIPEKGAEDAISVAETLHIPLHLATSDNYLDTTYYKDHLAARLKNPLFTFTGFLSHSAKNDWLKKAKALFFPIKWEEPFGMIMVEAMVSGTPVIAYNRGSVAEIVEDGVTGFIIDPDDTDRPRKGTWKIKKQGVEGLAEAVERIGEIDRAGCRKHIEENFSVENMVEGYENVYKNILQK